VTDRARPGPGVPQGRPVPHPPVPPPTARPAPARPVSIIVVAAIAAFTANIDLSIVTLALPAVGRAFGTTQSELAWTLTAYVLPYAVSILAVGRLGDGFGHRKVMVVGAILFGVGSIVSAIAPAYPVLLAGRFLQGLGGSALLTIGLAIVSANFSGAARGRALGFYFAAGASAAVVGPIVGGLLTSVAGWSAIFWCQIPLAATVAIVTTFALPGRAPGRRRSLDGPGLALGSLVLLGTNVALLQANGWGWTSPAVLAAWIVAAVGLVAFIRREQTAPEPAIRLSVFRSRIYVASVLVGGAVWFGIISGSVMLSIYLQTVRGLDAFEAALVLTPWPLLSALVFPRASRIVTSLGPERTMVGSLVVAAVAAVLMVTFDDATPLPVVSVVAALGGVPLALGVTASTVCALAEFPPEEAGIASGVFNSLRQVGSSFGVAIPAAAFDLAQAGSPGADPLAGALWAFASRAVVFAVILVAVMTILPRGHAVTVGEPA
jgi:EmrB/QacA subfamily drug resistance transporter